VDCVEESASAAAAAATVVPLGAAVTRTSTGIGDGGNEAGMGKVLAAVRAHVPRGALIACATPADALVAVGVSNWGAWAVIAAAEAAVRCGVAARGAGEADAATAAAVQEAEARLLGRGELGGGDRARPRPGSLLPTDEEEVALSRAMCAAGAGDGITGARDGSVDGLPLSVHLGVLGALRGVLEGEFGAGDAGAGGGKGSRAALNARAAVCVCGK
jgi:hypothetical protein